MKRATDCDPAYKVRSYTQSWRRWLKSSRPTVLRVKRESRTRPWESARGATARRAMALNVWLCCGAASTAMPLATIRLRGPSWTLVEDSRQGQDSPNRLSPGGGSFAPSSEFSPLSTLQLLKFSGVLYPERLRGLCCARVARNTSSKGESLRVADDLSRVVAHDLEAASCEERNPKCTTSTLDRFRAIATSSTVGTGLG